MNEFASTNEEFSKLADRLVNEGAFEIYRSSSDDRSKQVWLTEAERDAIVDALYARCILHPPSR